MPNVYFKGPNGLPVHLSVVGDFKVGDPPPSGYIDKQEWAEVQHRAGLRQETCPKCGLWKFPQELSNEAMSYEGETSDGRTITVEKRVCLKCTEEG